MKFTHELNHVSHTTLFTAHSSLIVSSSFRSTFSRTFSVFVFCSFGGICGSVKFVSGGFCFLHLFQLSLLILWIVTGVLYIKWAYIVHVPLSLLVSAKFAKSKSAIFPSFSLPVFGFEHVMRHEIFMGKKLLSEFHCVVLSFLFCLVILCL